MAIASQQAYGGVGDRGVKPVGSNPFTDPTFRHGEVETDLSTVFLAGDIVARITESDGESPARIIDANEDWFVEVYLKLTGSLLPMICGNLCFRLIGENIGPGGDDYEREADGGLVPLDPCGDGLYYGKISVPKNDVKIENCGTPYKLTVVATYLTNCPLKKYSAYPEHPVSNDLRPGPLAGLVTFPMSLFIYEGVEPNP